MMFTIQDLLARLRPRVLDELGLGLALAELIHHWRDRNRGMMVIHTISGNLVQVDEVLAVTVYRLMQECLTNISKHAEAKRVTIEIEETGGDLHLRVSDDGKGFDTQQTSRGYGLAGMRERVEGLAGHLHVESQPNHGTRIHIQFKQIAHFGKSFA